jgi:hypothetical protein
MFVRTVGRSEGAVQFVALALSCRQASVDGAV